MQLAVTLILFHVYAICNSSHNKGIPERVLGIKPINPFYAIDNHSNFVTNRWCCNILAKQGNNLAKTNIICYRQLWEQSVGRKKLT